VSLLNLRDSFVDPDRLTVSYNDKTVTVSLCGVSWSGTDKDLDQLIRAFVLLRAEAQTKRAVVEAMLPTKGER
jgi:hypothetical protein